MTNAKTNTGNLHLIFHPAAYYASPEDDLNDNELFERQRTFRA
ncbi:hypothetical protein [Bradyrhizobium arachidis]|nr:hypothetical protein [Bradyrhizobium arachidis]